MFIFETALQQGLLYSIAVFGIVISFRMMNYPDMTVDGSFTLGASVLSILISSGESVAFAMIVASLSGFIAGVITASLNRVLGISKILSSILVMLMLYSINLRIMGKANISLLRVGTVFTPYESSGHVGLVIILIVALIFLLLLYFSLTKIGLFIRATGDNEFMVRAQGVNTSFVYAFGIGLANMLVAFTGCLVAQNQGFSDISMGIGLIITLLASLIIGESATSLLVGFFRKILNLNFSIYPYLPWDVFSLFISAVIGSFIYFLIISICLKFGLPPTDMRLATGVLVIIGLSLQIKKSQTATYLKEKF